VLRTQVDIVLPEGAAVLNAADPHVVRMAELCDGEVIFYGLGPELPAIAAHRARGGRAGYLRDNRIMLASGESKARSGAAGPCVRKDNATPSVPPACWRPWAPPWPSTSRST
jgi:cyanophycin synthetase